jgi:ketosteroid isomerase-like protein
MFIIIPGGDMNKSIAILILGAILPITVIAGSPRSHIEEASAQFVATFNAGDGAALAGLYSENASLFPPGSDRVDGRAAIQAFWQGAMDAGMKLDELKTIEVDSRNDLAMEVGGFVLLAPGDSGTTRVNGQYIVVWKRTGHTWQLHRDIWNTK